MKKSKDQAKKLTTKDFQEPDKNTKISSKKLEKRKSKGYSSIVKFTPHN